MKYTEIVDWQNYIERVPGVMLGKPILKGTRITVDFVLERLAQGAQPQDLVHSLPPLTMAHIKAGIAYAVSCSR
jgi:uncharacterized protein (DUF433 family)